jgi:hypothetical protein
MKQFAYGVIVGVLLAACVLVPYARLERRISWDAGTITGAIHGGRQAADALEKEFGRWDGVTPSKTIYTVKHTTLVSIETNGVKTIRVCP